MYRPPILVAESSNSSGSSLSSARPWIDTNENGGRSSSMQRATRPSRARLRPLTVSLPVLNTMSSPSRTNQTGAMCGLPSARTVDNLAV